MILMFAFFSLFLKEKDSDNLAAPAAISPTNSSTLQAVAGPAIALPAADFYRISPFSSNFTSPGCSLPGMVGGSDNPLAGYQRILQLNDHLNHPVITLFFLQKIPEQGGDDDLPVLS